MPRMRRRWLATLIVTCALLGGCDAFATPIDDHGPPGSGGFGGFRPDAGRDAGRDAGHDAGRDAGHDAGRDASDDAGSDDGDASACQPGECGCHNKCTPS